MPRPDVPATAPPRTKDARSEVAADIAADIEVTDRELLLGLTGPNGSRLALIERLCGVQAGLRGQVVHLQGLDEDVWLAQRAISELIDVLRGGTTLTDRDIEASVRILREHPEVKLVDVFAPLAVTAATGKQIAPRGIAQRFYVQAIQSHDLVFGVGPAGTGKTYLAMAMAVAALNAQRVKRIVLTRPAVEAGERLGFLPGDMTQKVDPYLRPLYDALHDMLPAQRVYGLIERGTIEIAPLAFMRGRTLHDSVVVLDEAQNTTVGQMRMFLTRLGERSKAIITGDVTQVDLPYGARSGLADAVDLLHGIEGISICTFSPGDVVRHPLVQRIVEAYETRDAEFHADGHDDGGARVDSSGRGPRGRR
ncbi:MAG TPA: PhoH family protein [Polyangiales bacterium]|nr:PhoH family protein [Polyangiales bacterium]